MWNQKEGLEDNFLFGRDDIRWFSMGYIGVVSFADGTWWFKHQTMEIYGDLINHNIICLTTQLEDEGMIVQPWKKPWVPAMSCPIVWSHLDLASWVAYLFGDAISSINPWDRPRLDFYCWFSRKESSTMKIVQVSIVPFQKIGICWCQLRLLDGLRCHLLT